MRYQGSKRRMAPLIDGIVRGNTAEGTLYVEPFGGGMNSLTAVNRVNKVAADTNRFVIELWREVQRGLISAPEFRSLGTLTREGYETLRRECASGDLRHPLWMYGYAGSACSFGGGWWNGYAGYNPSKNEDHIAEAHRGFIRQVRESKYLMSTEFICADYRGLAIPPGSFIYCDPPYRGTKGYGGEFDSDAFFGWCLSQIKNGCKVLVSEYTAPEGFICVHSQGMQDGMAGGTSNTKTERLFVHESQIRMFNL